MMTGRSSKSKVRDCPACAEMGSESGWKLMACASRVAE